MKETRYLPYRISGLQEKTDRPKNVQSALKAKWYVQNIQQEQSDEFCLTVKKDPTEEIVFESDDKRKKKCVGVFWEENNSISGRRNTMIQWL